MSNKMTCRDVLFLTLILKYLLHNDLGDIKGNKRTLSPEESFLPSSNLDTEVLICLIKGNGTPVDINGNKRTL